MPRPVEFNQKAALDSASEAFRAYGYAGLSIKMLEQETGISSGSLYNSFGNKDRLFASVIDHYNEVVVAERIREHLEIPDPSEGLISMFMSTLDEPGGGALGCLLTNTAVEFAGANDAAVDGVSAGYGLLLDGFERALERISVAGDHRLGALRLLIFYQGLLVLIRHGHTKEELRAAIQTEISSIIGVGHV